jgi:uncharacterized SAM-binding protein YcdF (DUF218 family)
VHVLLSIKNNRINQLGCFEYNISLVLFRERWLTLISDFLIVQDTLKPADIIHVIAGDDYRTDYAFQLYQEGYGKTVFFTGGWCDIHLHDHGLRARGKALAQDLPLDSIASDDSEVMSTYMETEKLKEWMANNSSPVQSIIVGSDPFHMRRARWAYQKVFGDQVKIQMAPVPFERTPYQSAWWKDGDSRKHVAEEYFKLSFYLFRYQYSGGFFRDWLSYFDKM